MASTTSARKCWERSNPQIAWQDIGGAPKSNFWLAGFFRKPANQLIDLSVEEAEDQGKAWYCTWSEVILAALICIEIGLTASQLDMCCSIDVAVFFCWTA